MADIFYHLKKGVSAYLENILPYYFSVFTILLGFAVMILAGTLLVIFNSESMFYSDVFLNNSSQMELIDILVVLMSSASNVLIMFIFSFLATVVFIYLFSGLYGVCLEGTRGKAYVRTFFAAVFRRGGSFLLASIVLFILFGVFLFVLTIPIIMLGADLLAVLPSYLAYIILLLVTGFLLLPFVFLVPVAVVSGKGVHDSFRHGINIARRNYFELLVLQSLFFTLFIISFIIGLQINFWLGFILDFFLLVPLILFTTSSYYLDKSVEKRPEPKLREFPVDIVVPKTRTMPVEVPKEKKERKEKEKKPSPAPKKAKEIPVSMISSIGSKKKKRGIYVVASKTPITISGKPYRERKKREAPQKKARKKQAKRKVLSKKPQKIKKKGRR